MHPGHSPKDLNSSPLTPFICPERVRCHIRPHPVGNSGSRPLSHRQVTEGQK
ncbi:hypothetical protein B0T14DRAFT_515116 [Immersiella caudata]|uniref:Uncharacterized protein n=1 Tax=Immersiella caudata TaxID=314043 RepID=A0AA39WWW7_9PEZI|nr:hypothetical protein B0T14DRAFT_515116 [Immersiella caudata]